MKKTMSSIGRRFLELEKQVKKNSEKAAEMGYCRECDKTYPKNQLKEELNIEEGGWFDDFTIYCPKKHVIFYQD